MQQDTVGDEARAVGCALLRPLVTTSSPSSPAPHELFGRCFEGPSHGAWLVAFHGHEGGADGGEECENPSEADAIELLHVDVGGIASRLAVRLPSSLCSYDLFRHVVAADLDGDGDEELVAPSSRRRPNGVDEGPWEESGYIWTSKRGTLMPYAPLEAGGKRITFDDQKDVDGDGRPDLLTRKPYVFEHERTCGMPGPELLWGPRSVLHTLPDGTFSTTDAAAKAFRREACGPAPAHLVLAADGGLEDDDQAHYERFACALIGGASPADLRARLHRECAESRAARAADASLCQRAEDSTLCDESSALPWVGL